MTWNLKENRATVQLKIPHWAARMWGSNAPGWLVLDKELGDGATLGDLLADLVTNYPYLRNIVFNQETGAVSDQIMVILNDTLIQDADVIRHELSEGDSVTLLPLYAGG